MLCLAPFGGRRIVFCGVGIHRENQISGTAQHAPTSGMHIDARGFPMGSPASASDKNIDDESWNISSRQHVVEVARHNGFSGTAHNFASLARLIPGIRRNKSRIGLTGNGMKLMVRTIDWICASRCQVGLPEQVGPEGVLTPIARTSINSRDGRYRG